MKNVKAIVFDLGGVLVDIEGLPIKPEWMTDANFFEANWRRYLFSPLTQAFERGETEVDEFARQLIRKLQLQVDVGTFVAAFRDWPKWFYPRTFEVLKALTSHYSLALYSNISAIHWARYGPELENCGHFDYLFASYQIGMAKPDPDSFHYVARTMQLACQEILFLDDSAMNVEAASGVGMQAELVRGIDDVINTLERNGLLPAGSLN